MATICCKQISKLMNFLYFIDLKRHFPRSTNYSILSYLLGKVEHTCIILQKSVDPQPHLPKKKSSTYLSSCLTVSQVLTKKFLWFHIFYRTAHQSWASYICIFSRRTWFVYKTDLQEAPTKNIITCLVPIAAVIHLKITTLPVIGKNRFRVRLDVR